MIKINSVEFNKVTVKTNEAFLIRVTLTEEFAMWNNLNAGTWDSLEPKTWEKSRNLFLESPAGTWNRLNFGIWDNIKNKKWSE